MIPGDAPAGGAITLRRTGRATRGDEAASPRLRSRLASCSAVVVAAAALSACSTMSKMPLAPEQPAATGGLMPNLPPYRIQVGDVLDIKLLLNPELNEEVTVRPDGHISTAVAQDVPAYGLTVPELDRSLQRDYSRDLKNPRIDVVVKSFAPNRIYVGGEVTAPGEFVTVGPNLTLSQAVARAGGLKLSGDTDQIFIIRRGPGDVPEVFATRYRDVINGHNPRADVRLANYDIVYVPRTGIADLYVFWNQYVQQFVPVSWGFSYVVAPETGGTTFLPTGASR